MLLLPPSALLLGACYSLVAAQTRVMQESPLGIAPSSMVDDCKAPIASCSHHEPAPLSTSAFAHSLSLFRTRSQALTSHIQYPSSPCIPTPTCPPPNPQYSSFPAPGFGPPCTAPSSTSSTAPATPSRSPRIHLSTRRTRRPQTSPPTVPPSGIQRCFR